MYSRRALTGVLAAVGMISLHVTLGTAAAHAEPGISLPTVGPELVAMAEQQSVLRSRASVNGVPSYSNRGALLNGADAVTDINLADLTGDFFKDILITLTDGTLWALDIFAEVDSGGNPVAKWYKVIGSGMAPPTSSSSRTSTSTSTPTSRHASPRLGLLSCPSFGM